MVGDFDMPFVYSQEVITDELHLIAFSNIKTDEDSETSKRKTVHFKYDKTTNDFLIYKSDGEIVTLFKPEKGLDYWNKQVELYG